MKTTFKFETIEEAEKYYEENINTNSNNMNPEFERGRDAWVSDQIEEIRESYEEDNAKLEAQVYVETLPSNESADLIIQKD